MYVHEYASIWVRFLGEIAKCMAGSGKDKMRLEHLAMPESKEALKKKKACHKDISTTWIGFHWPNVGQFDQ